MRQKKPRPVKPAPVNGGELHQTAKNDVTILTTQQGTPIGDNQNSLKVGVRGPATLEDFHLREKLFHFDHERIPERVVHARGFGAHGFFDNYSSLSTITAADLFQRPGEKTPAFVRFSTVAGNKGSADLARDVRGFAVKLYTKQGNWDSNGTPIKADHKIGGGPSVLFDAVAILASQEGIASVSNHAAAREFAADAFRHLKFIGWVQAAIPLLTKAGIAEALDDGCIELKGTASVTQFVEACRKLRHWDRE